MGTKLVSFANSYNFCSESDVHTSVLYAQVYLPTSPTLVLMVANKHSSSCCRNSQKIVMTSCLSLLPQYIRTVSSLCLLSALLIWYKLVYGQFGQSNMHSTKSLLCLLWKTQSGLASSLKVSQQMLCVQSIAIYDGTFGNYRLHGLVQRAVGTLRRYFYQYFSHQLDFGEFQVFYLQGKLDNWLD